MKFKNIETGTIVEVPKENKDRINKFKSYPDKFVEIGEPLSNKPKEEDKKNEITKENNKDLGEEDKKNTDEKKEKIK